ncbi:exodeoxyribonuclease VII large subunit [Caldinitratiruptor microaerophilus]|uniref:Exodeoxyribonuclease 7 large subunit n=1 Tax=Caldinitratiruptor microaerophilus TaxID=671077 RepID=A0AA35G932_9FIRM|nr:exodeoxyribonuclease VII large subunit [Caldinitratiruptor microaerophilus]BDG59884.1 exodeoxyribonuclease 7 large subunit [Caldinitratiruptor microaerophilus]
MSVLPALPERREVLSVRALTLYVKNLIEGDELLADLWVRGEISNWRRHVSGHCYFTLKDEHAQVRCVMFRSQAARLRFEPEDGMRVLARGRVGVFERDGLYQFYVAELEPDGRGALHLAFEQLKARLQAEGLFDPARKRPLPRLPRKIGIVTSPTGAAIRDMITVARRRFPNVHIVLAPALVQGDEAPGSLIAALARVVRVPGVDVVIIGRGGGSLEELWAFNDEALARAIAACPVPVVSAVGHETDFTIADFVADLRAPTPSAAAELVVPSKSDLVRLLRTAEARLEAAARAQIARRRERLRLLTGRRVLQRPVDGILAARQQIDGLTRRLALAADGLIRRHRAALGGLAGRLDALSPLAVLARGYAIVRDEAGRVVRAPGDVTAGQRLEVILQHGRLWARAEGPGPAAGAARDKGE